ncbi:MAG: S41 family peptidase [Christensenellaceae bacterium]
MTDRRKRTLKRVLLGVLCVALAAELLMVGFLLGKRFPDPDTAKLLWIRKMISERYYEDVSDEDVYALIGAELLDPYSDYYDPEAYAELIASRKGSRSGFGFSYLVSPQEGVRILSVVWNSPAERAGLSAGMRILSVGKSEDALVSAEGDFSELIDSMDFQEGDSAYFATDHGTFCVRKEVYAQSYVRYRTRTGGLDFTGENALDKTETEGISALPEDAAYVRLYAFGGSVGAQLDMAMERFRSEGKVNLVLDLRDNGGGTLSTLNSVAKYFMKDATGGKPLTQLARYKGGSVEKFYADGNVYGEYFSDESRIYVLADDGTASASECLIGLMLDYHTISYADIYLSEKDGVARTYGKGIMQESFAYTDGSAIKLTTATVHWPVTDTCIHGKGVTPSDGANAVPVHTLPSVEEEQGDFLALLAAIFA